jgi:general secretion pathway protein K
MSFQVKLLSRNNSLRSQRGTAIIIALFVMVIAATASITMLARLQVDLRRTESLLNSYQTNQYGQGSIAWAIDTLNTNWQRKKPDQVVDKTPIVAPASIKNGYNIQTTIYDAQSFFNLNNLTVADYQFDFLRLLRAVEPKISNNDATKLATGIHDWLGPSVSPELAAYYAGLNPGYKAPHAPMASVSELRLIKGVTPDLYNKLLLHLVVLPTTTPININNASTEVLTSLSTGMSSEQAKKILIQRKDKPFLDTQSFNALEGVKNLKIESAKITVISNYFLVETKVSIGQQQTILYTLLNRTTQGPKALVTVLWQLKGAL